MRGSVEEKATWIYLGRAGTFEIQQAGTEKSPTDFISGGVCVWDGCRLMRIAAVNT